MAKGSGGKRSGAKQSAGKKKAAGKRAGGKSRMTSAEATLLDASELRWNCESIQPSRSRPRPSQLLGQERPLRALRTGLELYAPGFNIFVAGLLGSGRLRIVHNLLEELKPACRLGPDRVFVHGFQEPNKPKLIELPRGRARAFREDMLELGRAIRDALRQSLHSRWHRASRRLVLQGAEDRRGKLLDAINREAQRGGCALVQYRNGAEASADVLPLHEGEPCSLERFGEYLRDGTITRGRYEELLALRDELIERLEEVTERTRRVFRETARELQRMDRRTAERALGALFAEFEKRWPVAGVHEQLEGLRERVLGSFADWVAGAESEEESEGEASRPADDGPPEPGSTAGLTDDQKLVLEVHIVRTDAGRDCPVVMESTPTYPNLFGTIEPVSSNTHEEYGLGRIHTGSLLRADGGYLILRAVDLLAEPGAWRHLQRALKTATVEVREFDASSGTTTGYLQPEPIPIDVKVVLIGEPGLYEHLCDSEPQFMQLFKVHAEFDGTVPNTVTNRRRYADFLKWVADQEGLGAFSPQAAAAIVEFGARTSGRRTRLSTCFGDIADIAREAAHVRGSRGPEGRRVIQREHVESTLAARVDRAELVREQIERDFAEGYVLMRTSGRAVGVVNALTVLESQSLAFGKPVRVTATVGRANHERSGVWSIEREAELTGPLHDKGVLILEGLLQDRYGRDRDVSCRATICFEQLYAGLDGDSASCAEFIALLSSIARIPVRQGIAITGSLNQLGEIQAVGGVNEKVEGFFRMCAPKRASKERGVVLPRSNLEDLMLDPTVVAAVAAGRFGVWAVSTVDEALEILLGLPIAEIHARVALGLDQLGARIIKQ